MSSIELSLIRRSLSPARLASYGRNDESELEKLTNYVWNLRLSEALYPAPHAAEIALRNSIHEHISGLHGPMWFYVGGVIRTGLAQTIRKRRRLRVEQETST